MRTIPDMMRTDEVYPVAFGSFIFINIGLHASKRGTRSCGGACSTCGDLRVMFVDISPPVGTRVVGVQVARVRRHGREDGLCAWVCEKRMCESEAATNGVRETVECPGEGVEGAGTTAEGYEYLIARVCCICVRYRIRCARTRSMLPHLILLYS